MNEIKEKEKETVVDVDTSIIKYQVNLLPNKGHFKNQLVGSVPYWFCSWMKIYFLCHSHKLSFKITVSSTNLCY